MHFRRGGKQFDRTILESGRVDGTKDITGEAHGDSELESDLFKYLGQSVGQNELITHSDPYTIVTDAQGYERVSVVLAKLEKIVAQAMLRVA